MRQLFACAMIVCGCSATGVPIVEPEHVTSLATAIPQSELQAIASSLGDVVDAAASSWLSAPLGRVQAQLTSGGTMTIAGTVAQAGDQARTLTLTVAYDEYEPNVIAAVPYTDWRISSATPPSVTLTFTDEAPASGELAFVDGTFDGTVELARTKESGGVDDVDVRLAVHGELPRDVTGQTTLYVLTVSGVIYSPFDYYYNAATVTRHRP